MNDYLLIFGRTPELSRVEAQVFFPTLGDIRPDIVRVSPEPVACDGTTMPVERMIDILGGTVKIARVLTVGAQPNATDIANLLSLAVADRDIVFGVSAYGLSLSKSLLAQVKQELKQQGRTARYVGATGETLSSVTVSKNNACELCLVAQGDTVYVAQMVAVQDFARWSTLDYGRPYRNTKMGMLPPKIARMMANIALGADARGKTILDPFCGAGTILTESLSRSIGSVIGMDIDQKAVNDTTANFRWVKQQIQSAVSGRFEVCDASHVDEVIGSQTVHALATEPYLGPIHLGLGDISDPKKLKNILKGLQKLYIGALKSFRSVLAPHATVVFIIPQFTVNGRVYDVKNLIDSCENLGYTKVLGPIEYAREKAVVSRQIIVLTV